MRVYDKQVTDAEFMPEVMKKVDAMQKAEHDKRMGIAKSRRIFR